MASLTLRNIYKIYQGNVTAVNDFNLEIEDKEFIVLVGPSGCGKSTTLRMVAGLEEITKGELYIDDKLVNNVPPKDRDIAMVFQSYALYPHMTVYNNMAFGLKLRKVPKDEIDRRVREAAKILDIEGYRAFPKVKTKVRSEFSAKANMKRACDTIEENYAEDYTLESVANMANMSISYFCAQFRLEKGISFKEYLLNLRISHAKDMLRNSDLSVNEISKRVGYDDANYFSKVFRKCEGCTPSEFREK